MIISYIHNEWETCRQSLNVSCAIFTFIYASLLWDVHLTSTDVPMFYFCIWPPGGIELSKADTITTMSSGPETHGPLVFYKTTIGVQKQILTTTTEIVIQ